MIILIRHAQSEGNKNRDIHQYIPDHRVKLTPNGWEQVGMFEIFCYFCADCFYSPKMQAGGFEISSSQTIPYNFLPHLTAEPERPPKASSAP